MTDDSFVEIMLNKYTTFPLKAFDAQRNQKREREKK